MTEKKNSSKRNLGYILLAVGVALFVAAIIMHMQTRGTNLLYADAVWGKIYLYYWVPGVLSIGFLLVGICILKKNPKPQLELLEDAAAITPLPIKLPMKNRAKAIPMKEVPKEAAKQEPKETKKEVSVPMLEELKCEKCGAKLAKGAKFCGACGTPVQKKEQRVAEDISVEKQQVKEETVAETTAEEKTDETE